jgi:predicted phage terminase large subunit-like protein
MLIERLRNRDIEADPFLDFRNYLYYIFTEVLKLEPDDIQYDIADWMQDPAFGSDDIARIQTQAMRGCGKSVIACAFVTWIWYLDPTLRVTVIASREDKANEISGLVKQILDKADLLEHLRPDPDEGVTYRHGKKITSLKRAKNEENRFDIRGAGPGKDPSFAAYPVFGGWTGSHPDLILADDVEIPENSLTALKRDRLRHKLNECESLIMEGGMILYMGTPQTEESVYNKLSAEGYPIRKWPAELPDPNDPVRSKDVSHWLLQRVKDGEAVGSPSYPERFGEARLLEKKARGLAYYNLQMLLDTTLSDQERYPLKLRDMILLDTPADMAPTNVVWGTTEKVTHFDYASFHGDAFFRPGYVEEAYAPFMDKVMAIDPKGGGADSVGYVVAGFLNGMVFILDAGALAAGQSGSSEVVMRRLAKVAQTYGIKKVLVESNWAGGKHESTWAKLLQPVMAKVNGPTQIDTWFVSGQKEKRILDCVEPIFLAHRVVVSEAAAKCQEFTYQITHLTRETGALGHDDVVDALYGVMDHWAHLINLDPETREEDRRKQQSIETAKEWDKETARRRAKTASRPRNMAGRRWKRV